MGQAPLREDRSTYYIVCIRRDFSRFLFIFLILRFSFVALSSTFFVILLFCIKSSGCIMCPYFQHVCSIQNMRLAYVTLSEQPTYVSSHSVYSRKRLLTAFKVLCLSPIKNQRRKTLVCFFQYIWKHKKNSRNRQ